MVSARKLAAGVWRSESQEIGLQSSAALLNPMLERATKWDEHFCKPSVEVFKSFDHLKLLMDQHMAKACTLESKLKAELDWSRGRIGKLEAKQRSSKKKLESFLKKHAEAKASWRTREHEKIQSFVDGMRGELSVERKSRRRTEVLNSKLVDELAEAKESARRLMQDYEEEKKARELVEEVCDELAKEAGEDNAEVEEAKREAARVREELEEERKMLQVAEVWREERVQMKLVDAKQALQDQHLQLKKLGAQLASFLQSKDRTSLDSVEIIEAELLIEAVADAVESQAMETFAYEPPQAYDDIFAIFEELRHGGEDTEERDIKPCYGDIHAASPATDTFLGEEEESEWESLSNGDDLGSSDNSDNAGETKKDSGEATANGEVSKGGLGEVDFTLPDLDQSWSSPDSSGRRHASRGMKGCIEWPRGGGGAAHKHSLKAKLLEVRLESHKVQIRHVLEQKI